MGAYTYYVRFETLTEKTVEEMLGRLYVCASKTRKNECSSMGIFICGMFVQCTRIKGMLYAWCVMEARLQNILQFHYL